MNVYFRDTHERAFGTWPLKGDELAASMRTAWEVGYRAFDTAQMYENEAEVGATLREIGAPRDDVFVTTKVGMENFSADRFIPSVEASVRALGIDAADVLLVHWPKGNDNRPALEGLAEAHRRGLTRNVGVSNYTPAMMREAAAFLDVPIVTNQVEFHPLLDQSEMLAASVETGIPLSSYCSVARGAIFEYPELAAIAEGYGKTTAQVALRWILQKGVSINTMSTKRKNIAANFDVMGFTLSTIDMARIDDLSKTNHRCVRAGPWAA